jgi:circadian clock protein KaiB
VDPEPAYLLRLYVTGSTSWSMRAIVNIRRICEAHLPGRYRLEVVDILRHPGLARERQAVAVPMLVRQWPLPMRRLVGDLSQTERVLAGLGLPVPGDDGGGTP